MGAARQRRLVWIGGALTLVTAGALLLGAACGDDDDGGEARPELGSISAVAQAARRDAAAMDRHADAMAAAGSIDAVQLRSDEETIRTAARSLRALADWADSILASEALHPTSHRMVELNRLLGDGLNLAALGEMVVEHAGAMEAHVAAMRERHAGTPEVLVTLTALENNVQMMREDGEAAVQAGNDLADQAREFARGIGATIE